MVSHSNKLEKVGFRGTTAMAQYTDEQRQKFLRPHWPYTATVIGKNPYGLQVGTRMEYARTQPQASQYPIEVWAFNKRLIMTSEEVQLEEA